VTAGTVDAMADVLIDDHGRPEPPLDADEVRTLLGFLDYQRATLAWKCAGLDDEQLRFRLPSSALSLGGLLKHLARVEDNWFGEVVAEAPELEPWHTMKWAAEWDNAAEHTGDELRQLWADRVEASRQVVTAALEAAGADADSGLATTHPAWGGQGHPSLRWILVHMIEEYARHNGHADLLREAIDGETGE
jgi:uncharacterized damage-inducible protein DinB